MTPPPMPDDAVRAQIDGLQVNPHDPLIICDADEVLLQFLVEFEFYLERHGLWLDLQRYPFNAPSGNVKRRDTGEPVSGDLVRSLLADFFVERTEHLEAVPGAAIALEQLAQRARVVVLSNVPEAQRMARQRSLQNQGMNYPVIANQGLKGPAVAYLSQSVRAPVFFLDDIIHHLADAAKWCAELFCIHYIADDRLARLAKTIPDNPAKDFNHFQAADWPDIYRYISARLDGHGL